MPWIKMRGLKGLVFEPARQSGKKKHNCPTCFECAWCSDDRCSVCLKRKACRRHRSSRKSPG